MRGARLASVLMVAVMLLAGRTPRAHAGEAPADGPLAAADRVEGEGRALRAEGKTAEADARIEQAASLGKETEALEARLRGDAKRPDAAWRREVEAKVRALEAEAADLWAAGKMELAEERLAKAKALRASLDAKPAPKPGDDAKRGLEAEGVAELKRLRRQMDELKAAVEELRRRAPAPVPTPAFPTK